jgi:hypothetical protein
MPASAGMTSRCEVAAAKRKGNPLCGELPGYAIDLVCYLANAHNPSIIEFVANPMLAIIA